MTVVTLELGDEHEPTTCSCCGNTTRTVHGFVYADGDAHAVYFATWTQGHVEKGVVMAVGVGEWGEGASPGRRRSVGLECRLGADQVQFTLTDPEQSPWGRTEFLGQMLSREAALKDPALPEIFHIAEHVVTDDARVAEFIAKA